MPRAVEARAWWAEVEDVRERIERRRAREGNRARERTGGVAASRADAVAASRADGRMTAFAASQRGVREVRPGQHLMLVRSGLPATQGSRRRPRPRPMHRVGPRPDKVAAWAVALGFLLVAVAVLSAHG